MGQCRGTAALPSGKQPSLRTYATKGPILGLVVAVKRRAANLIPISISWFRHYSIAIHKFSFKKESSGRSNLAFGSRWHIN